MYHINFGFSLKLVLLPLKSIVFGDPGVNGLHAVQSVAREQCLEPDLKLSLKCMVDIAMVRIRKKRHVVQE